MKHRIAIMTADPALPTATAGVPDKKSFEEKLAEGCSVKKVIGVVSGKGGVGKSLVTSLMACQMRARGYKVGILDADITGPPSPNPSGSTIPSA